MGVVIAQVDTDYFILYKIQGSSSMQTQSENLCDSSNYVSQNQEYSSQVIKKNWSCFFLTNYILEVR